MSTNKIVLQRDSSFRRALPSLTKPCRVLLALVSTPPPPTHPNSPPVPLLVRPIRASSAAYRFGKMLKKMREDGCTRERSESKKPKACATGSARHMDLIDPFEEEFGNLIDSGQGVWSELSKEVASKLSESVLSIASFKGDTMLCACSGVVIQCTPSITTLLTSANLVRSYHDESKIDNDLTIRARYQKVMYTSGWLEQCDLHYNIAVINIRTPSLLTTAHLHHQVQLVSGNKVLAVGRVFNSRKLMATSGIVMDKLSRFDCKEFMTSTCKISKAGIGGPLIDFDGNFLGMNFYDEEETLFLPSSAILKCLKRFGICRFGIFRNGNVQGGSKMVRRTDKNVDAITSSDFFPQELFDMMHEVQRANGYPLATKICRGMRLINSFEEKFGNLDGSSGDVLNELSKEVASNLSQSVVSLASFTGNIRLFACTGTLIECNLATSILTSASLVRSSDDENKIGDNLKIEVHLPNKQCVIGTLQHCSLQYNIAVINIMAFPDLRAANLYHQLQFDSRSKVVAVGCLITSGKLMATCGTVTDKPSKFDCKELMMSTCKISKAGIGGPLIDFDGNFVGMNFYDVEETPFLPRNIILECLRNFETQGTIAAENIVNRNPNRWPVPKPYWFYPPPEEDTRSIEGLIRIHRLLY